MTQPTASDYIEGWRLVNEYTEKEKAQISIETKLADFANLFDFAAILRANNSNSEIERDAGEASVRAVWQQLKGPLNV
jgi:hypothetical protein